MHTLRARFKKDIIAEFLPPKHASGKVVVLCDGMPTIPNKKALLELFAKKGFWVFHPRYRGSWESSGVLLKQSPHLDVLDLITQLPKGFKSEWDGQKFKVNPKQIIILGSSFGGTTALMCAQDKRIDKVVALAPVVDWSDEKNTTEPVPWLFKVVDRAFGQAYRVAPNAVRKLTSGKFFNPMTVADKIDGCKALIIYALDDDIVNAKTITKFSKKIGAKNLLFKRGGHLGLSILENKRVWKIFQKHIKQKIRN